MTTVGSPAAPGSDPDVADLLERASASEVPDPAVCLALAKAFHRRGEPEPALAWCLRVTDGDADYPIWHAAGSLLPKLLAVQSPPTQRDVRLAILGSYTTTQLVGLIRLAALRRGIGLEIYESGYGLYRQEILDDRSGLYAFEPDLVLLAVDDNELSLPTTATDPEATIRNEVSRWTSLWTTLRERTGAQVIQTNFALTPTEPFGHLSSRLEGSRSAMARAVNARLGMEAGDSVAIVDCDSLAALVGKERWFDARYWHYAKQAVSLDSLPLLATHVTSVIAACLGMSRKCLILDLDGTLWGGIIGEDGVEGVRVGHGPEGEAFAAFQDYILGLKDRGVVLAVCSKNDEALAREAFTSIPGMRIKLDDIAVFMANWDPKPDNIATIARALNIGTDALTFVDDRAAEREAVRRAFPEVDVVVLPEDPAGYVSALARYPFFETFGYTTEDRARTEQYRARAEAMQLESQAGSLEEYLQSLDMRAVVRPFDQLRLARIVQLIGKTNQFNLTTRRHSRSDVEEMMRDPDVVHFYLELTDRFTDHGLVGLMIGKKDGRVLEIDTFLMSCRVIGRTVEDTMLRHLSRSARAMGCSKLRGTYIPTPKNGLVEGLYAEHGFTAAGEEAGEFAWERDLFEDSDRNPLITESGE